MGSTLILQSLAIFNRSRSSVKARATDLPDVRQYTRFLTRTDGILLQINQDAAPLMRFRHLQIWDDCCCFPSLRQMLENQFPSHTSHRPPFINTGLLESIYAMKPRALSWFPSWSHVRQCANLLVSIPQNQRFQQKCRKYLWGQNSPGWSFLPLKLKSL